MPRSTRVKGRSSRRKPKHLHNNRLTELEVQALGLMAEGKSNEEILAVLCISPSRLRQLKGQIRRKMNLDVGTSSRQIVQRARELGYIE